ASVSASDCHWNGDGVSGVDLSAISQQGGSCPIRLALAQARIAAAGSVGSSCGSSTGQRHPHPGGSAAQEAVSSDHSLLLVDRADRHLYWQHRSDLHPEAAATAFDSTDGAAAASNMPTVGEEDQSGLDESSLSSVANEQLDVDQLWDYSCQPDLYSDADDTDELDEQRTQAALLLEDSQLSLWEIDQPAMDLTSAGLLLPQPPASAVRRRKIAAELLETEQTSCCLATGEFDASAADMAAGVERLDRLADDLRRWLATAAAELEKLRQAEGESRQRRLLMENWELLIGWLQSDLDSCQSNRESLSRAHASMLELERLLCRCERLIQEELHRLRQLESASSFDRETAAAI
uniref:KASH domain-containing protein n=1 Tax=Macrostomum lignano TaxID=282301 RepID=A0A1I8IQZ2_9PLAT